MTPGLQGQQFIHYTIAVRERSGSLVECLTRDREAPISSLTGIVVLEQDRFILAYYWFNPGRPVPVELKDCSWEVKNQIKQNKNHSSSYDGPLYISRGSQVMISK